LKTVENIAKKIREEAKRLLTEQKVDVVIGYEKGTLPLTSTPCFITNPEDAEKLVWDVYCVQNLAKYAHDVISQHRNAQKRVKPEDRKNKVVGIVARGCTSRSIVIHLQERQYSREEVVIIGVPCTGYVDRKKIGIAVDGADIVEGSLAGDQLSVKTDSGDKKIALKDVLADNCLTCRFNNPVISDMMMGDKAPVMDVDKEYATVENLEGRSDAERWAYFEKEMAKCMRCYACRQACPSCYCPTCFAEQSMPQWVGIGEDASDTQVFQLMRLYHMVGRCVDCGSCIAVCPMGVDLRAYLKKIDKDVLELFDTRAGADMNSMPCLQTFKEHEKDESFVYNP
jgi:formate dehydrogenase (coenzyme F420) beta subunit